MNFKLGAQRLVTLRAPSRPHLPGWAARLDARLVLAGLLGLLLLAEVLPRHRSFGTLPALSLPQRGAAMPAANVQGWTETILARPLFNPGRRPYAEGDTGHGLPRLSAILISRGAASAIFAMDGQKPIVVQPGGMVDGDKVQSISDDSVVLLTAAGPVVLHPRFALGAPKKAASAPAPPGPPELSPALLSPKNNQPLTSAFTAGPFDNE